MKGHVLKRLSCMVLAAAMAAGLTACGSGKGTGLTGAQTETAEEAGKEVVLTSSGYDSRYFDEEGNMKLPVSDGSYTFKILWKKFATDVGTIQDKYMLQQALEATGIKVEIEEVSEQAWDEKLSIVFASGNLPDVICGETSNLINYIDQCTDLTDLFPIYNPFMSSFFLEEYPNAAKLNEFSGKLYSLSSVRINGMHTNTLWAVNKEWLNRVGMDIPETTDELYEVLKAFKEQDANGNGDPNDEIPYSFVGIGGGTSAPDGILAMMSSFGMVNDGASGSRQYIMVEDDKVKFAPEDQRFYDMLVYLNKLYSEGLIDQDGLVQEKTDRFSKGKEDRLGYFTHGGLVTTIVGDEVGTQFENILPSASEHGSAVLQNDPPAEMSQPCFMITKACPQPELMLMLCEYMNSTPNFRFMGRFGPEGGGWVETADGKAANATDFTGKPYQNRSQATDTLGVGFHFPTVFTEAEEDRREYITFSIPYNEVQRNLYAEAGGHAWEKTFPLGNDTQENSARRSELFAEIDTYIQGFVAECMTTGIDESKWQSHLSRCSKLGVEEFVESYQTLYDSLNN